MTQTEIEALQRTINAGFLRIDQRLEGIEQRLDSIDVAVNDMQQAVHGLMFKLLRVAEVQEIRATMKNPPDMKNFPAWVIR